VTWRSHGYFISRLQNSGSRPSLEKGVQLLRRTVRGENEIFELVSAWCLMVDCSIVQWTEGKCTTIAETTNKHGGEKVSPKQSAERHIHTVD
jgi:hypothetical protein